MSISTIDDLDCCLDVPHSLLPEHFCNVNVRALDNVAVADTLWVEPLGVEDWELLELDAAWLEEYGFLQQISLVYANQIVPLFLSNGIGLARVRVLENRNFSDSAQTWPLEYPCLQLKAKTHIIVISKSRPQDESSIRHLKVCITYQDCNKSERRLADHLDVSLINVEQCTAVVHPQTLSQIAANMMSGANHFGVVKSHDDTTNAVVRIQTSSDVSEDCIGTF